jgi:hypothetical protein
VALERVMEVQDIGGLRKSEAHELDVEVLARSSQRSHETGGGGPAEANCTKLVTVVIIRKGAFLVFSRLCGRMNSLY